ncbi:MAG: tetratricopeptide repeat protein [Verrucomicrobiae bacterium]|nr:tetratricopeptide repeat protein [Verrucomicrobiae bacterium]
MSTTGTKTGADAMRVLRRAVTRAEGFALHLAICNHPAARADWIAALAESLPGHLARVIPLDAQTEDALEVVLARSRDTDPGNPSVTLDATVLMVVDLELAVPSNGSRLQAIHNLNLRRSEWRDRIRCPVVFWVPEYLAALCTREAPDFFDWRRETIRFPDHAMDRHGVIPEEIRGTDSSLPPADFRLRRLQELESRLRLPAGAPSAGQVLRHVEWQGEAAGHEIFLGRRDSARARIAEVTRQCRQAGLDAPLARLSAEWGNALAQTGDLAGAHSAYRESLEVSQRQAAADPDSMVWQRNVSVGQMKIGDVLQAQGDSDGALAAYRKGFEVFQRLAAADPANALWRRDVSVSQERIGGLMFDQGDLAGAMAACQNALELSRQLAAENPGNPVWQRDLSVSLDKLGDVLHAQGDFDGAMAAYREALAISQKLAEGDPGNPVWQRDGSVGLNKVGDVLRARGDLIGAEAAYREALAVRQRLMAEDPDNAVWKRDVAISCERLGDLAQLRGDRAESILAYTRALDLFRPLVQADPTNAALARGPTYELYQLAELFAGDGMTEKALACAEEALAIRQRLSQLDPAHPPKRHDVALSRAQVARLRQTPASPTPTPGATHPATAGIP